jgi:hypothetical protein
MAVADEPSQGETMIIEKAAVVLISAVLSFEAIGAVTTIVVDVPSGSHSQRFLYLRPDAPAANIIYLAGGSGILDIQPDGKMGTGTEVKCGPVVRLRDQFAGQGFAVALVDQSSIGEVRQFGDVNEVIRYMQGRDNVPTWLIGGSSSTGPTMSIANALPSASPVGVVLFSPDALAPAIAGSVTRPIQIVYQPLDAFQQASLLFSQLTAATVKEKVALNGGTALGCGYHLFAGLDAEFVATITSFIDRYNGTIGPSTPTVQVVEYRHAAFDHYFITPVAGEIALLDAHAPPFEDWSRTGLSFNVYPNAGAPAGSVAICRFFNDHFAPKSSHFYGPKGSVCDDTIAKFPDWGLEDDKLFNTMLPNATTGACPAGTIPVYRMYNQGMGNAPNHRFVTSLAELQKMINQGWVAEGAGVGVGMCVPAP